MHVVDPGCSVIRVRQLVLVENLRVYGPVSIWTQACVFHEAQRAFCHAKPITSVVLVRRDVIGNKMVSGHRSKFAEATDVFKAALVTKLENRLGEFNA